jgi:Fur family peroxide stress response transcriptional regulator
MARKQSPDTAEPSPAPAGEGGLALGPEFRLTKQRREVFEVLTAQRDHPTATEVFVRVKEKVPGISLATVYNCLETLTQSGLVRQVNLDRSPSRYCPNLKEHAHFHCESCGTISDIDIRDAAALAAALNVAPGSIIHRTEIALRGLCPTCATTAHAPHN